MLRVTLAAADVFFHEFTLMVQLDGSGHFENNIEKDGEKRKATTQYDRDGQFNKVATERGYNILRFHYTDVAFVEFVLSDAFSYCMDMNGQPNVIYSTLSTCICRLVISMKLWTWEFS